MEADVSAIMIDFDHIILKCHLFLIFFIWIPVINVEVSSIAVVRLIYRIAILSNILVNLDTASLIVAFNIGVIAEIEIIIIFLDVLIITSAFLLLLYFS